MKQIHHHRVRIAIVLCVAVVSSSLSFQQTTVEQILSRVSKDSLQSSVQKLVSFGTRHTLSDTLSNTRGIGAARRWIYQEFQRHSARSKSRMSVALHYSITPPSRRNPDSSVIVNVIATLHPRNPSLAGADRRVIVSAHYDSRASDPMDFASDAPGANDDGSGTALVLELARVFAPHEFDATLMFIAFAGEEQGLLGATNLAREASRSGWKIEAVLNNDIVGNTYSGDGVDERGYVRLFSQALTPADTGAALARISSLGLENDGRSRNLARFIKMISEGVVSDFGVKPVYRLDRFLRGGDHRPFHGLGFAAVRFSVARENYDYQHQNVRTEEGKQYGDLPEYMNFDYLANVTRINAAVAATIASAPAPPVGARLLVSGLEYTTTLVWNRNMEPDMKEYRIVYRPTSASEWAKWSTTSDTSVTLPLLKDDYLFGIQAVDRDGFGSIPTIPTVGR